MTDSAPRQRSLRTELVVQLTLLLTAALVLPSVLLLGPGGLLSSDRRISLGLVVAAETIVFAGATWLLLRRTLLQPLRDLANADQRRAHGAAAHQELHEVGAAIDRMAARLHDDQSDRLRVEKAAST